MDLILSQKIFEELITELTFFFLTATTQQQLCYLNRYDSHEFNWNYTDLGNMRWVQRD